MYLINKCNRYICWKIVYLNLIILLIIIRNRNNSSTFVCIVHLDICHTTVSRRTHKWNQDALFRSPARLTAKSNMSKLYNSWHELDNYFDRLMLISSLRQISPPQCLIAGLVLRLDSKIKTSHSAEWCFVTTPHHYGHVLLVQTLVTNWAVIIFTTWLI